MKGQTETFPKRTAYATEGYSPALLPLLSLLTVLTGCILGITHGKTIVGIGYLTGGILLLISFFILKRIMSDVLIIPIVILLLSIAGLFTGIAILW